MDALQEASARLSALRETSATNVSNRNRRLREKAECDALSVQYQRCLSLLSEAKSTLRTNDDEKGSSQLNRATAPSEKETARDGLRLRLAGGLIAQYGSSVLGQMGRPERLRLSEGRIGLDDGRGNFKTLETMNSRDHILFMLSILLGRSQLLLGGRHLGFFMVRRPQDPSALPEVLHAIREIGRQGVTVALVEPYSSEAQAQVSILHREGRYALSVSEDQEAL